MKLHQRLLGAIFAALLLCGQAFAAEQSSYQPPTSGPMSMATFVGTYLNPALRALATCNWGTTAPANGPGSAVAAQQCWWDTSGTPYVLKWYVGGQWIALANMNASTHVMTIPGLIIGTDVQAYDADLAALAANSTDGLWAHTGTGTGSARTLTAPAAGLTITNPAGIAGNPTFALANDLAALEGLSSTGFAARTTTDTWAQRTLQAPAAGLTISNPAGVAGDPTFALVNDLAALEGLSSTGFAARTTTDTWAQRSLQAPAAGFTITNPAGVAGDPTFVLANDLGALEGLSCTGAAIRSATDTWLCRTIGGTANEISVANGDGVSGAPTISLPSALTFSGKTITGGTYAGPAFTGTADNQGTLKLSSFVTSTQITSSQNNYTATDGSNTCSTKVTLRVSSDASRNITGLSCGQAEGDIRIIHNVGAQNVVLTNQDTGSTAANRFLLSGDVTLLGDYSITVRYDGVASRWRAITTATAGAGGGVTSATVAAGVGIAVSGTCTITTTGTCTVSWDDAYRQNALIDRIYQSKVFAGFRRGLNAFADGFKASDGINSGSSSNYSLDTSGGKVTPTVSPGSYTSQVSQTLNSNSTGFGGLTARQLLPPGSGGVTGAYLRITLTPPTTGNNSSIDAVYVGHAGTAPNFDGTQVPVLFSSSASVTLTAGGSAVVSDAVAYAYDNTKSLIVAIHYTGTSDARLLSGLGATYNNYEKAGSDASGTTGSGYSSNSGLMVTVSKVESAPATPNNMTLVTASQTSDSTVGNGRVLLEFDNTATPTLNTDLTVEVTCDGGSHWTSASLSSVSTNGQGGRKIVETVDQAVANTGTSFAARIKTLNNKSVPIYGASLTVH